MNKYPKPPESRDIHRRIDDVYLGLLNWKYDWQEEEGGNFSYHIWISKDERHVAWEGDDGIDRNRMTIKEAKDQRLCLEFKEPLFEMIEMHNDPSISPNVHNI